MPTQNLDFWRNVDEVRELALRQKGHEAQALFDTILASSGVAATVEHERRERFLGALARTFDLELPPETKTLPPRTAAPLRAGGVAGISLVSACRDRLEGLIGVLPDWIRCNAVSEIVLVDWGSRPGLREGIVAAGLFDPRIRVIRVEEEDQWSRAMAYNAGLRFAAHSRILKIELGSKITPAFFDEHVLDEGSFIASAGRPCSRLPASPADLVFAWKADLAGIGGYNEYLGSDEGAEDELCRRLAELGLRRRNVAPEALEDSRAPDIASVDSADPWADSQPALTQFLSREAFRRRSNRFIADVMPAWGPSSNMASFDILDEDYASVRLRRQKRADHVIPKPVIEDARYYALSAVAAEALGDRLRVLSRESLEQLLEKPLRTITPADVELAIQGHAELAANARRHLVMEVSERQVQAPDEFVMRTVIKLSDWAGEIGLSPVVRTSLKHVPEALSPCFGSLPLIDVSADIGEVEEIALADLHFSSCLSWLGQLRPVLVRLVEPGKTGDCLVHVSNEI